MNATQMKYAKERAAEIYRAAKIAVTKAHTAPDTAYSPAKRCLMLKAGQFKLHAKNDDARTTGATWVSMLDSYISFNGESHNGVPHPKALKAALEKLDVAYRVLLDTLMLGEASDAIKSLDAFAQAHGL